MNTLGFKQPYFCLITCILVCISCTNSNNQAQEKDPITTCKESGGEWKQAGFANEFSCITPYKDAGHACSDSNECEGKCAIFESYIEPGTKTTGICSPNDSPFGCYALINKGIADHTICVD